MSSISSGTFQPRVKASMAAASNSWTECHDSTSGYPYYWNTVTNEVRWDKPQELLTSVGPAQAGQAPAAPNRIKASSRSRSPTPTTVAKLSKKNQPALPVIYGPSLPAEELAAQKLRQFEEDFAKKVRNEIDSECPPDWASEDMPRALHTSNFRWDTKSAILPVWKTLLKDSEESNSRKKESKVNSIGLIASYGDSDEEDDEDDDDEEEQEREQEPNAKHKRKLSPVRAHLVAKAPKTQLKPVPKIFQDLGSDEDDENDEHKKTEAKKAAEDDPNAELNTQTKQDLQNAKENVSCATNGSPPKEMPTQAKKTKAEVKKDHRGRRIYESSTGTATYKKSIDSVAALLCDKLEALEVSAMPIAPLKLLACKLETLFAAWESGALSPSYLQKVLAELSQQMLELESTELAPPGWRASWDSGGKKYSYTNLVTGEVQFEKPIESDSEDEDALTEENVHLSPEQSSTKSEDVNKESRSRQESPAGSETPPLPPLPPTPPPPPASAPEPPPPLPPSSPPRGSGVVDMELDDEETEATPIVETKTEDHLRDDPKSASEPGAGKEAQDKTAEPGSAVVAAYDDTSNSPGPSSPGGGDKRKKKSKLSAPGISMKKKNVGNLVAKWQNIQDEVKRNS